MARPSLEERFWSKVDKNGPIPEHRPELGPCWVWIPVPYASGYGQFSVRSRATGGGMRAAHRVAYELVVGPIPEGLTLDHLCKRPYYVNPRHLDPCTNVENVMRGNSPAARKARQVRCEKGHPFDEGNTRWKAGGTKRLCIACERVRNCEHVRAHRARKRQKEVR